MTLHKKMMTLNKVSIRTQLLVLATVVILTIVSMITIFNYSRSTKSVIEQNIATNKALLSLEGQNFSKYLSNLNNYSLTLRNDSPFLQKILTKAPLDYSSSVYIQSLLKSAFYSRNDLKSYKLYLLNQYLVFSIDSDSMRIATEKYEDLKDLSSFEEYIKSPDYCYMLPSNDGDVFMIYYRAIIDVTTRDPIAMIELSINQDYMRSLSVTHENLNNCFGIFDKTGQCFYTNKPEIINGEKRSPFLSAIRSADNNYYYTSSKGIQYLIVKEETNDFYLVTLTPSTQIKESLIVTRNISFAIGIISILISIALFTYFIRMITSPLSILANHMKNAGQGDFSQKKNLTGSSEIYYLTKRYNSMMAEINDLIKKNYVAKYNEEQAKLIALEAQVNPHFINNSLQTIATEAIVNKQSKIYDMIIALASLQRYAIKGPEMVSIESEIEKVQQYLFLQKSRLGDALIYEVDIDKSAKERLIPKLSIMTLVENSIIHGISGKKSSISIQIHAYLENDNLCIKVSDTGAGITAVKLNEIYEKMNIEAIDSNNKQYIGLLNLNSRLKILYHNAQLIINSTEHIGTTILVCIPLRELI